MSGPCAKAPKALRGVRGSVRLKWCVLNVREAALSVLVRIKTGRSGSARDRLGYNLEVFFARDFEGVAGPWIGRIVMKSVFARTALVAASITAVVLAGGASRVWK
jgi:hypothetical protein